MHCEGTEVEEYFSVASSVVHVHCQLSSAGGRQCGVQRLARARVLGEGGDTVAAH